MKASKPQSVRQDNLAFLAGTMKAQGPLSQRQLAELTGLSVVTVNKLIPVLLERQVIQEASQSVVTGGRRAISYEFNAQQHVLFVMQLIEEEQQFYLNFYICDVYGEILVQEKRLGNSLSWLGIKELIGNLVAPFPQTACFIIGIPGVEKDGISQMMDYPPLLNVNLRGELAEAFHVPVLIENDINAAVLGCAKARGAVGETIIGLYYPNEFPPGAGIFLNGQIIKGRNGFAGEVKYLPLPAFEQWDQLPVKKIDLKGNVLQVIQSLICLYDPDEIVVYTSNQRISAGDLRAVSQHLGTLLPELDLPLVAISTDFNRDYLRGLIAMGIELIDSTS